MLTLILQLCGLQAILLGILIGLRKSLKANRLLAALLLCLGVSSLLHSINNLEVYLQFPHLIRINWGLPLLFSPLIYLYTLALLKSDFKFSEKHLKYFLPYIINLIILLPFFIQSGESKIQTLDYFTATITGGTDGYQPYFHILHISSTIVLIYFSLKAYQSVQNFQQELQNEYADTAKIKLRWLNLLIYSFVGIALIAVIVHFITIQERYASFDYEVYFYLALFILVYVLTYQVLHQPLITHSLQPLEVIVENAQPQKEKILTSAQNNYSVQILLDYMQTEKPYLKGDLTASELATSLNITRHQLSEILNEQLGKNFYDFINEYRVAAFKERVNVPKYQHLTLLGIALESGFNSKTSFNTVFKKLTGETPTEYKNHLKNSEK